MRERVMEEIREANQKIRCVKCNSENVDIQVFQENVGDVKTTTGESKIKQKGHGCLYWLCGGWFIDLCLWIVLTPVQILRVLFKKKKYDVKSSSTSVRTNKIVYKKICLCKDCGATWQERL